MGAGAEGGAEGGGGRKRDSEATQVNVGRGGEWVGGEWGEGGEGTHRRELVVRRLELLVRLLQRDPFRLNGRDNVVVNDDVDHETTQATSGRVLEKVVGRVDVSASGFSTTIPLVPCSL